MQVEADSCDVANLLLHAQLTAQVIDYKLSLLFLLLMSAIYLANEDYFQIPSVAGGEIAIKYPRYLIFSVFF